MFDTRDKTEPLGVPLGKLFQTDLTQAAGNIEFG